MSETIEDAKTEPRPIWTKLKDGWKVRIPKEWWDNWSEAGETDEFPVVNLPDLTVGASVLSAEMIASGTAT